MRVSKKHIITLLGTVMVLLALAGIALELARAVPLVGAVVVWVWARLGPSVVELDVELIAGRL